MAKLITAEYSLKEIAELLKCSVCMENFKEPQILPCYHVFCKSPCLEKLVTIGGQALECPTCRHSAQLPASGVSGFQSDFHIDQLFRIHNSFSDLCQFVEKQCGNCRVSSTTGYCYDCEQFICENCRAAHKRLNKMSTHNIATLDQLLTDSLPFTEKIISEFEKYLHLDRLFEMKEIFYKVFMSFRKECDICKKKNATGYCHECLKLVCEDCQVTHKQLKSTNHKIITLDDLTNYIHFIPSMPVLPLCPLDSDEELMAYCESCCEVICFDCTVRLHRDHGFDLGGVIIDKHKEEIMSGLRPVRENLDIVQQAMKVFDHTVREINEQRVTVKADIYEVFGHIHRLLNQQRDQLVGKLDLFTQQKLMSLTAQKDEVKSVQVQLNSCLQYAEDGLKTGTQEEVLAMKDPVVFKRIEEINAGFDQLIIQPETKADLRLLTVSKEHVQTSCQPFVAIISDSDSICHTLN